MFVQVNPPIGPMGPIKIEGVRGLAIAQRLRQLAAENAYEAMLIGLVETPTPIEHANAIADQYAGDAELHDGWFEPTPALVAYIQHVGQAAIQELLSKTHPAALTNEPVDIDEMARILGVAVVTVRRMIKAKQIPCMRFGRTLRFVPTDVVASLQRR